MASPSKTIQSAPITRQNVAAGAQVISTPLDVSTIYSGTFWARIGRRATTALTVPCYIRFEGSYAASGNDKWQPLFTVGSGTLASESEAITGTQAAGNTTLTVASTTNLTAGDIVFFDNGTPASSEWGRIKSIVTNTSITLEEGITNAQTGSTVYDQADIWNAIEISFRGLKRVRVVVDNSQSGQNVAVEVGLVTLDSIA